MSARDAAWGPGWRVRRDRAGDRDVFSLLLDGRPTASATATVGTECGSSEDGADVVAVVVNWSALGDVSPRAALDFAAGLLALTSIAEAERSALTPRP